jgi:hypothetical protein
MHKKKLLITYHEKTREDLTRDFTFLLKRIFKKMDRQCIYNAVARSFNYLCIGKSIHITYSELVFVALGIQLAMCMRHIVIYDLFGSIIFFHIMS